MKINSMIRIIAVPFFIPFVAFVSTSVFAEDIKITTDEQAHDIYVNHAWKCKWKGGDYEGTSEYVYEEASLKKIAGKIKNSYCPSGWGKTKGKVKKGLIVGKDTNMPSPCAPSSTGQTTSLTKSANGYTTKSKWRTSTGLAGTAPCTATPK